MVWLALLVACASKVPVSVVAAAPAAPMVRFDVAPLEAPAAPTRDRQAIVDQAIHMQARQLAWCYENRLKVSPALSGRVHVGWTVEGGAVEGIHVTANDTGDAELAACIVERVARWRFPAGTDGPVTWPFAFAER